MRAAGVVAADKIEPAVKLSQNGHCDELGSSSHNATLHYHAFDTRDFVCWAAWIFWSTRRAPPP